MLIVPPNCCSVSLAARSASVPGIWRLRLVEVVARVAREEQRDNKSAYPEDQDRHRPADREPRDLPHLDVLRIIRFPLYRANDTQAPVAARWEET